MLHLPSLSLFLSVFSPHVFLILLRFYFNLVFPLLSVFCCSLCLCLLMASRLIDTPDVFYNQNMRNGRVDTAPSLPPWLIEMSCLLCLTWAQDKKFIVWWLRYEILWTTVNTNHLFQFPVISVRYLATKTHHTESSCIYAYFMYLKVKK